MPLPRPLLLRLQDVRRIGPVGPFQPGRILAPQPQITVPLASSLADNFDDNSRDVTKWIAVTPDGGTVAEQNGRLEATPTGNGTGLFNVTGYKSVDRFNLIGSSFYAKLAFAASWTANEGMALTYTDANGHQCGIFIDGSGAGTATFNLQDDTGGSFGTTYNAATHGWFRIRESGGATFWDYAAPSADPTVEANWTNVGSRANSGTIDYRKGNLAVGAWLQGAVGSPVTVYVDGFNSAASAGTTYNDTLSESLTGADALATDVSWGPSLSEAVAANDSLASTGTFGAPLAEGLSAADDLAAGLVMAASVSEAGTAADSYAGGLLQSSSVTETVTAADTATVQATFRPALSESLAAADAAASSAAFGSSLASSLTAADAATSSAIYAPTLTATVVANDNVSSLATMFSSLAESLAASDSVTTGSVFSSSVTEQLTAAVTQASAADMAAAMSEAVAASDGAVSAAQLSAAIANSVSLGDQADAAATLQAVLNEAVALADAVSATVISAHAAIDVPAARIGMVERPGRIARVSAARRAGAAAMNGRTGAVSAQSRVGKVAGRVG